MILLTDRAPRIAAGDAAPSPLTQRAMIVSMHLPAWGGQRIDRKATRATLRAQGADDDAGKFSKLLVPKAALDPVKKAQDAARDRNKSLTLPWGEGSRILSATMFLEHARAMTEERTACERAYRTFCEAYPGLLESAPARLGDMYNRADFPDPSRIAERFGFKVVILPIPDSEDFRVSLGTEIETEIRGEIETTVRDRYGAAQREVWERVFEIVKHFAETMATEGKTFQETTVSKLREIATVAPKLSLVPDPQLEEICEAIKAITHDVDANALRVSKSIRRKAAGEAQAAVARIEDKLRGAFIL